MSLQLKVPENTVYNLLDECSAIMDTEGSKYPSMSYEEGIKNGIEFILGLTEDHPLE